MKTGTSNMSGERAWEQTCHLPRRLDWSLSPVPTSRQPDKLDLMHKGNCITMEGAAKIGLDDVVSWSMCGPFKPILGQRLMWITRMSQLTGVMWASVQTTRDHPIHHTPIIDAARSYPYVNSYRTNLPADILIYMEINF